MAFFFKVFPEIIMDERLYIAEPPLYRIDDKKDPFVVNMNDYNNRYVKLSMKNYKIGINMSDKFDDVKWLNNKDLNHLLSTTSSYVDDMIMLAQHYKSNDRLLEMILEEFVLYNTTDPSFFNEDKKHSMQHLMDKIGTEFPEIYYDDKRKLIRGIADGKRQMIEISKALVNQSIQLIGIIKEFGIVGDLSIKLLDIKTSSEYNLSLLQALKILKKFQPNILHRFKGLGENDDDDIKTTIMDPNTRSLIRVQISDIENDIKIFQLLRGNSAENRLGRKTMMKEYVIPASLIDT